MCSSDLNRWFDDSSTYDADAFNGSEKAKPDWGSATAKARGGNGRYTTHAFGLGARINPTDKLHIIAGGRYTSWKRDFYWDHNLKDGVAGSSDSLKRNRFVPYARFLATISSSQRVKRLTRVVLGNGKSGKYKLNTQHVLNDIEFRFYDPAASVDRKSVV